MTEDNYYVYLHRRVSDGLPFYVGKGRYSRSSSRHGRNRHWHRVVKKHGIIIEHIHSSLSEEESKLLEVMEINNKRARGYPMTNINNGGDGNHGWVPSEETKRKISKSKIGSKASKETRLLQSASQTGRKHPQSVKDKISDANKRRTPEFIRQLGEKRRDREEFVFVDTNPGGNGFVIATRKHMQENYGLNASKISDLIFGRRQQHKGWVLVNHEHKTPSTRKQKSPG